MANVSLYNMDGNEVGSLELNDKVFGADIKEGLVHQAVVEEVVQRVGVELELGFVGEEISGADLGLGRLFQEILRGKDVAGAEAEQSRGEYDE